MSGIFGSGAQVTTYSGIDVQQTSNSLPIPIAYGQNMFTPNLIDYQGFKQTSKNAKGGTLGKVLGGSSKIYTADILMGICEGPINGVPAVYQTSYTPLTLSDCNLNLMNGAIGQAPWSYFASEYSGHGLAYSGIAYLYAEAFDLGPSASVGSNNLIVNGVLYATGFNGYDADPAQVIYDFMTNAQYGVGFPAGSISTATLFGNTGDGSLQNYCWTAGLAFSPVLTDKEPANATLTRWFQLLNCEAVWSSGVLKFIPRGDSVITGNGHTYVPNLTVVFSLTDEDFIDSSKDDPVVVIRSDPYLAPNRQSLDITGRNDNFNTGPITVWDQSAQDRFGLREGSTISAHEICDVGVAQTSAQLILQRGLLTRRTFQFKLSWEYGQLDPMDIGEITDSYLNLKAQLVRITEIEEADDGMLSVTAEEFIPGVGTSVAYAIQAPSNGAPSVTATPNPVNAPIIVETPPRLSGNTVQLLVGVSPQSADPNWGGANVWVSFDGTSFGSAPWTTVLAASAMGATTANLPTYTGTNPDATDTLAVDISESGQTLASTTTANAYNSATLCYVGGEYIAYTTATLTGAGRYALTGLYRGLFGVAARAVANGSPFLYLPSVTLKDVLATSNIGQTLYFKFQSFNIFGLGVEDLSTCTVYSYVITGVGVVPMLSVSSGNAQTTVHSTAFASGLGVLVTDEFGAAIGGVVVTFTSPSSGASCTWSAAHTTTATTNASGVAISAAPTANATTGGFTVTAAIGGYATSFSLTNT